MLYQFSLLVSKICVLYVIYIQCMLFLYLRFKFNEVRFKGINGTTNHSCKCMVVIISQLEKNASFKSYLDYTVYHSRDIEVKYRLNDYPCSVH